MSASIFEQFLMGAFPRDSNPRGNLVMLSAYFDDSGTHNGAPVVAMGGLIGDHAQWLKLEKQWRAKLANPVRGRPPLKRFHMADCQAREGEFRGWKDGEVDLVTHDFREIIFEANLHGYICALSSSWNEIIKGNLRTAHGDAEQYCVICCYLQSLEWARENTADDTIHFVFDNRPHRKGGNESVQFAFRQLADGLPASRPIPIGISSLSSELIVPLQAADMVVWEYRAYATEWEIVGKQPKPRPHLARFMEKENFFLQYGNREAIERIAQVKVSDEYAEAIGRLLKLSGQSG